MSAGEALALCRRHSAAGTFVVSQSAHDRLKAQGLSLADVHHLLATATGCTLVSGRQWTLQGQTLDSAPMSVLVAFDEEAVTVI